MVTRYRSRRDCLSLVRAIHDVPQSEHGFHQYLLDGILVGQADRLGPSSPIWAGAHRSAPRYCFRPSAVRLPPRDGTAPPLNVKAMSEYNPAAIHTLKGGQECARSGESVVAWRMRPRSW